MFRIKTIGLLLLVFLSFKVWTQEEADSTIQQENQDSSLVIQSERFLAIIEETLLSFHKERIINHKTDSIIQALGYEKNDVPSFSDSIYCSRLAEMNKRSPFHLDCNEPVLKTIDFFARKRRQFTAVTMGRSGLYFAMFEEKLAKHDMPIELKYLSVIESGLRPQVKSRAGALGLWQFMYRTGKMYGLEQDSYIDQRMDPELATEAACLYLKHLHKMYNDWNMALAAYNAGPGNVNKAIRRSGGKMTYWEIRPYLPRETQGYVPNFIAMAYMMTYHAEHNIYPLEPAVYDFELDTVCIKKGVHMKSIDTVLQWPTEEIQLVNPIYKMAYIPETNPAQCINIPTLKIKDWIALEDSIYKMDSILFYVPGDEDISSGKSLAGLEQRQVTHYVRSGESLSVIGSKYGVSVSQLMDWNNLRSTKLKIGQKLIIYGKNQPAPEKKKESVAQKEQKDIPQKKSYTIQSGDSLWKIAREHDTTVENLIQLNPGIDYSDLKVGQQIQVRK